jgi:hypothetical protein
MHHTPPQIKVELGGRDTRADGNELTLVHGDRYPIEHAGLRLQDDGAAGAAERVTIDESRNGK